MRRSAKLNSLSGICLTKLDVLGIPDVHSVDGLFFRQEGDATAQHRHVWRADYDELLAWLDKQWLPLNRIILDSLIKSTAVAGGAFTVCMDGKPQRYQAHTDYFSGPVVLATTCGAAPRGTAGLRHP